MGDPQEVRWLIDLGIKPYGARVLVALVDLGEGNSTQVHEASGVPRTSVYAAATSLTAKGLVQRLEGGGVARWSCAGWDAVLDTLDARAAQRLVDYRALTQQVRDAVRPA